MKRKKTILIAVGCLIAVGIYLFLNMNEKTVRVSKVWELTDEEAASIQLIGVSQNLDIKVQKSEGDGSRVVLEGSLPKSYAEKLQKIKPEEDKLLITFVNNLGFSMGKLTNQMLNMTIYLSEESLLEDLTVKSNRGDVTLHVPKDFERKYRLMTNSGEITEPRNHYDVSELITIELGYGDIKVIEE